MILSWLISFCSLVFGSDTSAIDPCDVYGKIYVTGDARRADFRVYVEDTESFADVIVFKQSNSLFADRAGQWNFVNNRDFARVIIYWEKQRNMADFSIAYTDVESFAGCNR